MPRLAPEPVSDAAGVADAFTKREPKPSAGGPGSQVPQNLETPPSPPPPGNPGAVGDGGAAEAVGPEGTAGGAEGNALKARAIALYRAQLIAWFLARFEIRGKIPFDTLKGLQAIATVSIAPGRTVSGYQLVSESGDAIFDAEVRATLARIQSSGAPLPAPPPLYPDLLGASLSVSFKCTVRSECE